MARRYAQIFTEIWRNTDFTALDRDEQWMYLLLNTQPDITAAGVLTIAAKRWAGRAPHTTVDTIHNLMERLAAKRFLVIDWDTDEVLLRTFIKHDHGYSNPKRQPAIRDAINLIESPVILTAVAAELRRHPMPEQHWGRAATFMQVDSLSGSQSMAYPEANPVDASPAASLDAPMSVHQNAFPQENRLSDSDGRSERRVPLTPNHNPKTSSKPLIKSAIRSLADDALIPVDAVAAIHDISVERANREQHFAAFWAAYPRKVGKQGARKAWDAKVKGTRTNPGAQPSAITAGAVAFGEHTRAMGTPIDKVPHPQTWLNRGSWEDELPDPARIPAQGGFDARAAEFDVMRDRLRNRDATPDSAAALIRTGCPELTAGGTP